MKKLVFTLLLLQSAVFSFAQKASDVLENGIRIGTDNVIVYKYNTVDKSIKYGINRSLGDATAPINFLSVEENNIFLCTRNAVNVYARPLNPLNYSYSSTVVVSVDPINESASKALSSILSVITKFPDSTISNKGIVSLNSKDIKVCKDSLIIYFSTINKLLQKDKKEIMSATFNKLKALDFSEQETTVSRFKEIKQEKTPVKEHYEKIKSEIEKAKTLLSASDCIDINDSLLKMQLDLIVQNFSTIYEEQFKRFKNLEKAFESVENEINKASIGGGESGLRWCILLKEVSTKRGEISAHSLQVFESGYNLSSENEIVVTVQKELVKNDAKFRRFQRFVPEVSVGTAYTFFKYYEYGTTTDAAGKQYVATPTEKEINNLNISTMVNFTYYIENSAVHPFWQIGAGANAEVPSLLTGFGLRGVLGTNRISISGGIAMTWIKELDNLKVGDEVTGTAAIDQDLKNTFSWPPKAYIGLQYNF